MSEPPDLPENSVWRLVRPSVRRAVDEAMPKAALGAELEPDDERALCEFDDPQRFHRRFGFLWPWKARRQLHFFQHDFRLSDGQIRRLNAAKTLDPTDTELRIRAYRLEAILGWAHILVLAVVFGPLLILGFLAYGFRLGAQAWLGITLVLLSVVSLASAYYAFYVTPWRVKERVRREKQEVMRDPS